MMLARGATDLEPRGILNEQRGKEGTSHRGDWAAINTAERARKSGDAEGEIRLSRTVRDPLLVAR